MGWGGDGVGSKWGTSCGPMGTNWERAGGYWDEMGEMLGSEWGTDWDWAGGYWDETGGTLGSDGGLTEVKLGAYWDCAGGVLGWDEVYWDEMGCTGMRWGGLG